MLENVIKAFGCLYHIVLVQVEVCMVQRCLSSIWQYVSKTQKLYTLNEPEILLKKFIWRKLGIHAKIDVQKLSK